MTDAHRRQENPKRAAALRAEAESLAVIETGEEHRPIGILTEAHAMRRYAEESERRRREVVGDG